METNSMPVLLAPGAVAARLRLSVARVQQLDDAGVLPALRDSANRRLYDGAAVEIFAQARERAARDREATRRARARQGAA
jgi:hypothetical protein